MKPVVLVAGVGNIFFGDDAFGVEVVRRLARRPLPELLRHRVRVVDFGIAGVHLAFELLEAWQLVVVVDAMARDGPPGTVYLIAPERVESKGSPGADAHSLYLPAVFAAARAMGAELPPVLVVGCEPATTAESLGLSAAVEQAIEPAIDLVLEQAAAALRRAGASKENV